jgi:phage tail protein X
MGSFQQILMGVTCLAAAFFFGSYLHNRPAENEQVDLSQVASVDPLDSLFSFGKVADSSANGAIKKPTVIAQQNNQGSMAQLPAAPVMPAIDPSERAPLIDAAHHPVRQTQSTQSAESNVIPAVTRKPIVPDFSELASRFRNSPLELSGSASTTPESPSERSAIHQSERAPGFSTVFDAPEMVIRQPEKLRPVQPAPIQDFSRGVDRIEESIRNEFAANEPKPQAESTRWRVNRSRQIDQFRNAGQAPRQDFEPQQSIEDVLSRRSADYLKDSDDVQTTFATDPVQDDWMTAKRLKVTRKAAQRNQRDPLEIEDPGNRFHSSVIHRPKSIDPPEPDFETAYYTPTRQRQDAAPPVPVVKRRMQPIQSDTSSNWSRQSNIQSQFANTYEIQSGDTLQSISMRFYGSADYYLEIYKANREVLDRITSSPAGVEIEIPSLNN